MSQVKDFMELIEEDIPSASSLGLRPIPSRPLDRPQEYYQQSLDNFGRHLSQSEPQKAKNKSIGNWKSLLIIVLCIGAGIGVFLANHSKPVPKDPAVQEQKASTKTKVKEQPQQAAASIVPDKQAKKKKMVDLSLGKAVLGMSMREVKAALGGDKGVDLKNGYKFHQYNGLQVGEKNGTVDAIVSDGPAAKTALGLHEGATFEDMVKAYGKDYVTMKLDDLVLYEYPAQDKLGRKGLLRFAIRNKDKKIDYISIRVTE